MNKHMKQTAGYARKDFVKHKVQYLSPGRWAFKRPGTGNLRMYITEMPEDNLAISGDAGETFFIHWRNIYWLRNCLDRLLEKDRASWGYLHEKTGNARSQQQFNDDAIQDVKDEARRTLAESICDCDATPHGEECKTDNCACDDAVFCLCINDFNCDCDEFKACECDDRVDALKMLAWWEENKYAIPDIGDEGAMYSFIAENEYPTEDHEGWPDFLEYSTGFIHRMYGMAMFFKALPVNDNGDLKGSLSEFNHVAQKYDRLVKISDGIAFVGIPTFVAILCFYLKFFAN